jgi:large subunit ribosomal protein L30
MEKTLTVRWARSASGRPSVQRDTIRGLGLRRLNDTRTLPDQPAIRGMIQRVIHLLDVTE